MLESTDKTQAELIKTQAELIAELIRHQASLARWIIVPTLTSVVTGIVAIAALVVVVLQ